MRVNGADAFLRSLLLGHRGMMSVTLWRSKREAS
jgi:hypothetical protein